MNQQEFWPNLYYIRLRRGMKMPASKWGGYDQDFETADDVYTWDKLAGDGYYGYIAHNEKRLGVLDLDAYKDYAPDPDDISFHRGSLLIKSPSGGFHIPFLIPDGELELRVRDKHRDWVDLKGEINAGHAVFPHNSDYKIVNDGEIRTYHPGEHTEIAQVNGEGVLESTSRSTGTFDGESPYASIYNLLDKSSYPEGERVEHPFHGSSTGANFMVDHGAETWRCWRHETTGNLMHLAGIKLGHLECGEWDLRDYEELRPIYKKIRDNAPVSLKKPVNYTMSEGIIPEEVL